MVVLLGALVLGSGGSASAISAGQALPFEGFGGIAVDAVHGHVFVTGLNTIAVRNLDGTAVTTIPESEGPVSPVLDNGLLYVSRCGEHKIDVIDTATLAVIRTIDATVDGGYCNIAVAGGRIWYGSGTDGRTLTSVPADGSAAETVSNAYPWTSRPRFATTPVHPNWLIVGDDSTLARVDVWDVSDPVNPTKLASVSNPGDAQALEDLEVTPDGDTLLIADGATQGLLSFSLPDMATQGTTYTLGPNGSHGIAVAVTPDGNRVAGTTSAVDDSISLFNSGDSAAKRTTLTEPEDVTGADLAFSPDGTKLYAVTIDEADTPILHVLPGQSVPAGSLTLKPSASIISYGRSLTLTAHLGTKSANKTVSIYRTTFGQSEALLKTAAVNAKGNLVVTVKPGVKTTYRAMWDGDSTHAETHTATITVNVRVVMHALTQGGYRTLRGYRLYHYTTGCPGTSHRGCPQFLLYASPGHVSARFTIVLQTYARGAWHTRVTATRTAGVDGRLLLNVVYTGRGVIGVNQRLHASMARDADHLGGTSPWRYFRVTS